MPFVISIADDGYKIGVNNRRISTRILFTPIIRYIKYKEYNGAFLL